MDAGTVYKDIWGRWGTGWENQRHLTWSDEKNHVIYGRVGCAHSAYEFERPRHAAGIMQEILSYHQRWARERTCDCPS